MIDLRFFLGTKLIDKFDYCSFDIYDTLIERETEFPSDVFTLVQEKAIPNDSLNFKSDRIKAEQIARETNANGEVTLEDIYKCFPVSYDIPLLNTLLKYETYMEINVVHQRIIGTEIYKYAYFSGKPIVLISDMYLSSAFLNSLLNKNGIFGYKKIFVSCEYGCSKLTGDLFKVAYSEIGWNPQRVIHFGNSLRYDALGANKIGANCFLLPEKGIVRKTFKKIIQKVLQ